MKRHLTQTVAITLMLLLSVSHLPVLCGPLNGVGARTKPFAPRTKRSNPSRAMRPQAPRLPGESATLLTDGRTLLLGGEGADGPQATAEIRDNNTGAVTRLSKGLMRSRAWHTATVLPDGLVLILSGVDSNGELVTGAELFAPENQSFRFLPAIGLTDRAYHSATPSKRRPVSGG